MHVMSEVEVMSLWRRPAGSLDRKVCAFVLLACAVTLAVTLVGPRWFWSAYGDRHIGTFWIHNALALLVGALLAGALIIRGTSASLRLALTLPLAQLAAITVAWSAWLRIGPQLQDAHDADQILRVLPMGATTSGVLAICAATGRVLARGRDCVHGMVVMALGSLLAVGLWLPLAAAWYCKGIQWLSWEEVGAAHPYRIVAFVLVPPLCAALAYARLVMRAPTLASRLRPALSVVVPFVFLCALIMRAEPSQLALAMYGNFVHVLLALTIAAITSIAVLGLTLLLGARRAGRLLRDARTGTIECDGSAILLELPSWLRGPRLTSRAFTIRTAHHLLVIPPGVELVSPVPAISTQLRDHEALELARHGDPVVVGGFVDPDPDHPFRSLTAPQPGPHGLVVARAGKATFGDVDVALALWRPCVAYLVIVVAVALPGLIAALAVQ
jgi:hypothetical protein